MKLCLRPLGVWFLLQASGLAAAEPVKVLPPAILVVPPAAQAGPGFRSCNKITNVIVAAQP